MKHHTGMAELVARARQSEPWERRHIYGGDPQATTPGYAVRVNRRGVKRKRSTFYTILLLFAGGIAMVLYISNILAVNALLKDINQQQMRYERIVNANQILRKEIDGKSGLERVGQIAARDIGLVFPRDVQVPLDIPDHRLESGAVGNGR